LIYTPERIEEIFTHRPDELSKVKEISREIHGHIETVKGFIEESTLQVCSRCQDSCCIERYSFYNCDDLVYIYALGLEPRRCESADPAGPCHFLARDGCVLDRAVRPSGCNWHFCDTLTRKMREAPGTAYADFNESMGEIMALWIELMREFRMKFMEFTGEEMNPAELVCASDIRAQGSDIKPL
jgi:hypothetical protein